MLDLLLLTFVCIIYYGCSITGFPIVSITSGDITDYITTNIISITNGKLSNYENYNVVSFLVFLSSSFNCNSIYYIY